MVPSRSIRDYASFHGMSAGAIDDEAAAIINAIQLEINSPDYRANWLNLFRLYLIGNDRIIFMSCSLFIIIIGLLTNSSIIVANLLYRMRYSRTNEFYTAAGRRISGLQRTSTLSGSTWQLMRSFEGRNSYFQALSNQTKFKYSHVIFAVALFGFFSCLLFIPTTIVNVCGGTPYANVDNAMVIALSSWTAFQICFMTLFFFINTVIQFFSLVLPLRFTLHRSPLIIAFVVITIFCVAHTIINVNAIIMELEQSLFKAATGHKLESLDNQIALLHVALAVPLFIFILTWTLTVVMYVFILRSIHDSNMAVKNQFRESSSSARASAARASRISISVVSFTWKDVAKRNLQSCIILGSATFVFYILELPVFLVTYTYMKPHYGALLAHISVHAINPILHISLSRSFRKALRSMLRTRRSSSILETLRKDDNRKNKLPKGATALEHELE